MNEMSLKYGRDADKLLAHARQSAARWLEYFKNIGGTDTKYKQESDWEPLHIGFRSDDDDE